MATKSVSEQLRQAIQRCSKTRYRISRETGIDQATLSRFVHNRTAGLTLANVDKLCKSIGLELVQTQQTVTVEVIEPRTRKPKKLTLEITREKPIVKKRKKR